MADSSISSCLMMPAFERARKRALDRSRRDQGQESMVSTLLERSLDKGAYAGIHSASKDVIRGQEDGPDKTIEPWSKTFLPSYKLTATIERVHSLMRILSPERGRISFRHDPVGQRHDTCMEMRDWLQFLQHLASLREGVCSSNQEVEMNDLPGETAASDISDDAFPWPLSDMAEYQYGRRRTTREALDDFRLCVKSEEEGAVVLLVNLPEIPEPSISTLIVKPLAANLFCSVIEERDIVVPMDDITHRSKGCAFLRFPSSDLASRLISEVSVIPWSNHKKPLRMRLVQDYNGHSSPAPFPGTRCATSDDERRGDERNSKRFSFVSWLQKPKRDLVLETETEAGENDGDCSSNCCETEEEEDSTEETTYTDSEEIGRRDGSQPSHSVERRLYAATSRLALMEGRLELALIEREKLQSREEETKRKLQEHAAKASELEEHLQISDRKYAKLLVDFKCTEARLEAVKEDRAKIMIAYTVLEQQLNGLTQQKVAGAESGGGRKANSGSGLEMHSNAITKLDSAVPQASPDLTALNLEELQRLEQDLELKLTNVRKAKDYQLLVQRQQMSRKYEVEQEQRMCSICADNVKTVVLLPCRHLCVCNGCSSRAELNRCPICRERVSEKINVFIS